MEKGICILFCIVLLSCQSEKPQKKYYKANSNDTIALLQLITDKDRFYGDYEIKYSGDKYSGQVRGEIAGDTLIGRFKYKTAKKSFREVPFVLLKSNDIYIQGTGVTWMYFNIPYFDKKSIQFKSTNLHFIPSK